MNRSPRVILSLAACSACGLYDISDKFDGESETAATTHFEADPSAGDPATSTSTPPSTTTSTSTGTATTTPSDTSTSSSSTNATEDPPPPPPEVAPDTCSNSRDTSWVFVTPFRVYGDLSPEGEVDPDIAAILTSKEWSLTRADKVCQHLAQQANLAGQYVAWISTYTDSVRNRLESNGTIHKRQFIRLDNTCVAETWDIWKSNKHRAPVNIAPGADLPIDGFAWTGTRENGESADQDCFSWSCGPWCFGDAGYIQSNVDWSNHPKGDDYPCDTPHHLYCLQYAD